MSFRTTILLFLVAIGLGAYLYWVELPKAEKESTKKTLVELKEDDVTALTLVYPDREIDLKKVGNDWRMTKPVDAAADAIAVKGVLNAIAQAEVSKELGETATDLSQYGLDKPTVTVTVTAGERTFPALLIGKTTPVGFNAYVKKADEPKVVLTSGGFRTSLDKQAKDLRDKSILSFSDSDVRKIEIHSEGQDLVLVQKDNQWRIEQPAAYAADPTAVRNFLSTLRSLRAVDFPAEQATDLASYGLDTPRLKIVLSEDGAQRTLLVGKENQEKQVYVQRGDQPTVYAVNDWVFRDLNKSATDFRDKTILAFDRDTVTAIQITGKDGTVKLVRGDDKQWRVEGTEGKAVQATITQYLADLGELKGSDIAADQPADLAAFGLDQPQLAITLFGEGGREIGTILLGQRQTSEGKTEHTAMKAGGTTVFLVRDYQVTRLNKKPDAFIEKAPAAGAPPGTPAGDIQLDEGFGDDEPGDE